MLLLALALVGIGVICGALLIDGYWREERARLAAREARLNALWRALQADQRLHLAFWVARRSMQQEADRQRSREEYRP